MRGGCEPRRRKTLNEKSGRKEETPEPTYRKRGAHLQQVNRKGLPGTRAVLKTWIHKARARERYAELTATSQDRSWIVLNLS